MSAKATDREFSSLQVGEESGLTHSISADDVNDFASLSGDQNPLHMDDDYAAQTLHKKRVVHGMFLGALVSRLIGMQLPGVRSLLVRESLEFKKPVHIGDEVTVSGKITSKSESTRLVQVSIVIKCGDIVVATGDAHVKVS
jgi:3-hydroxybutyryl-CoA dehydratase